MNDRFRDLLEQRGFIVGDEQDLLGLTDAEMDLVKARMSCLGRSSFGVEGTEKRSDSRRAMTSKPDETA
jgi:hypothetical protein